MYIHSARGEKRCASSDDDDKNNNSDGDDAWNIKNCDFKVNNWVVTCWLEIAIEQQQQQHLNNTLPVKVDDKNDNDRAKTIIAEEDTDHVKINNNYDKKSKKGMNLNLKSLTCVWSSYSGCNYKNKMFPSIGIKFENPKGVINLSASGRIVCTGATSKYKAIFLIRKIASMMERVLERHVSIVKESFTVQNIASSSTLPGRIFLSSLSTENESICTYDPKKFSGAIIRLRELHPITILVFASGKIVITGGKDKKHLKIAFATAVSTIKRHCANLWIKRQKIKNNLQ